MRFTAGFVAGLAAAWAALAIWQRIPGFPDLSYDEMPDVEPDPDIDGDGLWSGFGGGR